jgi:hypothetical protein
MTRFKELCMDSAADAHALGRFWTAATGSPGIAICPVPEEKTVKHRVHIDVHTDSVDTLLALGATRAPGYDADDPWTVLLDPEGGEFCAFVRDVVPASKLYEVVVDSADPRMIADWWAQVFGVEARNEGQTWSWLEEVPGMPFELLLFDTVPEPKTAKNRVHWDVYGDVTELLDRGATLLDEQPRWTVLADPEGNEFCVFPET